MYLQNNFKESSEEKVYTDMRRMSRDEILEHLESQSKNSESESSSGSSDWIARRSLTGKNASGWRFQDTYYGHIHSGRRPAMDTAWGRRIFDQYEIELNVERPR